MKPSENTRVVLFMTAAAALAALAAVCVVSSARADATLTCVLTGAGAANSSVPLIVSDADGGRILAAAVKSYSPVTVAPVLAANDPKCATSTSTPGPLPGDPPVITPHIPDPGCFATFRQATNKEAITSLLHDMLYGTLINGVKAGEQAAAVKTANDAIVPIAPK